MTCGRLMVSLRSALVAPCEVPGVTLSDLLNMVDDPYLMEALPQGRGRWGPWFP